MSPWVVSGGAAQSGGVRGATCSMPGHRPTLQATLYGQFSPRPRGGEMTRTNLYMSLYGILPLQRKHRQLGHRRAVPSALFKRHTVPRSLS